MVWRAAHGRARQLGALVASELCPSDELPAAAAEPAAPQRSAGGHFLPGNRIGRLARRQANEKGALGLLERKGDRAARAALRFGRRYAKHRRLELTTAHGAISAGVGAIIESAGELLASARYWNARSVAEANPDFARLAAQQSAGHRQAERDAWELAAREAEARSKLRTRALIGEL